MNKYMRQFLLFVGVGSLAFSLACGGGGNGGGFGSGGGGGTGSFTNASLSGQYAYQLKGYAVSSTLAQSPFREAGVFTADGNGHITGGKDDVAAGGSPFADTTVSGAYQVNSNGLTAVVLNFASGASSTFEIALSNGPQFYMIETDAGFTSSGTIQKQDTSTFANVPSGTYVLSMHTLKFGTTSIASTSSVGAFTVGGGTVTGNMDRKQLSSFTSSTITGTLNFPDATSGRGSGTFNDSSSGISQFLYYVVDTNHLIFFSNDGGTIGVGEAERQTTSSFTTASFTGPYAFGTSGDTNFLESTNTAGRFNADGSGAISAGVLDTVTDGTVANVSFTGSYTVAGNGRAVVTLTEGSNSVQQVYWMVSPTRAFFITNSPTSVEDGSLDSQVGSFSSSTLNGTYAFDMTGFDSSDTNDLIGTLQGNGTNTLSMLLIPNVDGFVPTQASNFSGTYTVNSNGRAVGTLSGFSNNLVMYMVSGNNAYMVQADSNIQLHGTMTKQP